MAIQITIDGADYTRYVDLSSIQIDSNIAVKSDTANKNIIIPKQAVPRPKGGQEIKIWNGTTLEFGGVVVNPGEDALAPDQMQYSTQCRDYIYWFDKRVVVEQYFDMPAGAIVLDIINRYTTGFTAKNVQGTDLSFSIPRMKFDHIPPSEALQKLADAVGFLWWIDYQKDVHFGPLDELVSPLPFNILDVDNDTQNYGDLHLEEDVSQVRNQIYLLGHKIAAQYSITEKFIADGQTKQFRLNYEPQRDITQVKVMVGDTKFTSKRDLADGSATSTTQDNCAYIYQTNQSVRVNEAPTEGTIVSVTYRPRYEMVNMYNDPNAMEVMKQRDGMDGVYEWSVRDQQLSGDDTSLVDTRGKLELSKWAFPHYSGTFYSYLQGWRPGQYFLLSSNKRMDGIFQGTTFYVTKVTKTIVNHPLNGSPTFKYNISISDTPFVF